MSDHKKIRFVIVGGNCVWHENEQVAVCGFDSTEEAPRADAWAVRIAACLNACDGISTVALHSWVNPPDGSKGAPDGKWTSQLSELWKSRSAVEQQRDELLTALKLIRGAAQNAVSFRELQVVAAQAIAKAEGNS